jgi:phosphatidylinositol alpha 1,6-mannosyltransferase
MTASLPRVAYFPDSFHEVNGVAHTSRHFEAFARRRNLPFLCVRAGTRTQAVTEDGNVWTLELPRSFLSFALEKDLRFDPAFLRHIPLIGEALERFQPDLIHITGPSEIGILGAWLAQHLDVCRLLQVGTPTCTSMPRAGPTGSAPAAQASIRSHRAED